MKTFKFTSLIFICMMMFFACSTSDEVTNTSSSALTFKVSSMEHIQRHIQDEPYLTPTPTEQDSTIFSGADIIWFNETTGELRLKNFSFPNVNVWQTAIYLHVYDENGLLHTMAFAFALPIMSNIINKPVLYYDSEKLFIHDGYPNWSEMDENSPTKVERRKNWAKMEPGWSKFIEQLKKEGKYRK